MKENNYKNILRGVIVIAFALCLLLDNIGMFPNLPLVKIGILLMLFYVFAEALKKLSFVGMTFPLGLAVCLFTTELGIKNASIAVIILVSVLVGIGLELIFSKPKEKKNHFERTATSYSEGEGTFDVDNNMGARTEYIQVKNIRRGKIDNALGKMTVYLNGSTVDPEGGFIDMDNGLGKLVVYIPKELRVSFVTDNGLGKVNIHGESSHDESLPLLTIKLDNGLGEVDIYFE